MTKLGIIGDVHGNLEALQAVLAALDKLKVESIYCLGDLIGYNADPNECIALLRDRGVQSIAGNHDLIGVGRLGFENCSNKAAHALKRTRGLLSRESAAYLRGLPARLVVEERILLIHGGVRNVEQYMTRREHFSENRESVVAGFASVRFCFYGHTHEQRVVHCTDQAVSDLCREDERPLRLSGEGLHFINPGSVDGSRNRSACSGFAVFDTGRQVLDFHRVPYDGARSEAKAVASRLRIEPWRDRLYDYRRRVADRFSGRGDGGNPGRE